MTKRHDPQQTVYFQIPDVCPISVFEVQIPSAVCLTRMIEQPQIAVHAVKHLLFAHPDLDLDWPLTIHLLCGEDGPLLARLSIGREMEPQYYVSHIKGGW